METKGLRLAELLTALSVVTDLGIGRPPETAMRACILASRLAAEMGVSSAEASHAYYATLLLSMDASVQAALGQIFERWDGHGIPHRLHGEDLCLPVRFAHVATHVMAFLSRAPALQSLALIAGMHHERQNGSGYFRGAGAPSLSPAVRLLCAADTY
jgi:HD-GYP domain-containing protein (c-di-GMP phosphodiesterase class II)